MYMYGMPEGIEFQLENACAEGNMQSVRRLCSEGADVEFENPLSGHTPLMIAAWYGQFQIVEELLLRQGASPLHRDRAGITALHYAAEDGFTNISRLLIRNGANVNQQNQQNGQTALHIVCAKGFLDFAISLVENNANLKIKDSKGETAEDVARAKGYDDIVSLLTAKDEDEIASIVSAVTVPADFSRPYMGSRHSFRPQLRDLSSVAANASIQHEQLREQIKNLRRERADFFAQFDIYKNRQQEIQNDMRSHVQSLEQRIDDLQEAHVRTVNDLNGQLEDCQEAILKMVDKFNIVTEAMAQNASKKKTTNRPKLQAGSSSNSHRGSSTSSQHRHNRTPSNELARTTSASRGAHRPIEEEYKSNSRGHRRVGSGANPIQKRTANLRGNTREGLGARNGRRQVSNDTSMSGSSRSVNRDDADDIPRVGDIQVPRLDGAREHPRTPIKSPGLFTARTPTSGPQSTPATSNMPSLTMTNSTSHTSQSRTTPRNRGTMYMDEQFPEDRLRLGALGDIPSAEPTGSLSSRSRSAASSPTGKGKYTPSSKGSRGGGNTSSSAGSGAGILSSSRAATSTTSHVRTSSHTKVQQPFSLSQSKDTSNTAPSRSKTPQFRNNGSRNESVLNLRHGRDGSRETPVTHGDGSSTSPVGANRFETHATSPYGDGSFRQTRIGSGTRDRDRTASRTKRNRAGGVRDRGASKDRAAQRTRGQSRDREKGRRTDVNTFSHVARTNERTEPTRRGYFGDY